MKQPSLTARRQSTMRRLTEGVIKGLLQFKLTHDLTAYEIERLRSNWRDVEVELHTNYPLSESGIVAVLENNRVRGLDEEEFFLTDEPIAPEDTVSLLGSFPLNAASCAYIFTMLEVYGDDVVATINPTFSKDRLAWHRDIYGADRFKTDQETERLCAAFGRPFKLDDYEMSSEVVLGLMRIKQQRNRFSHEGELNMSFDEFLRNVLRIICYIHLMVMPDPEVIIVHNSDDLSGRFEEAQEFWSELLKQDQLQ